MEWLWGIAVVAVPVALFSRTFYQLGLIKGREMGRNDMINELHDAHDED